MVVSLRSTMPILVAVILGISSTPVDFKDMGIDHSLSQEDFNVPLSFHVESLPSLLATGLLEVDGYGMLDVVASSARTPITESWEIVDGSWQEVPAPQRFLLAFPAHANLAGEYHWGPSDQSAVLTLYDASNPEAGFELSYRAHPEGGWLVTASGPAYEVDLPTARTEQGDSTQPLASTVEGAAIGDSTMSFQPIGPGTNQDSADSSGGTGRSTDSTLFQLQCTYNVDCLHPEALIDIQLEGDEDAYYTTSTPSVLTLVGAWVYSDGAWTSSMLSSAASAMEDRLWVQEASIEIDVATYRLNNFPGSWEFWNGLQERDKFRQYLHGRVTVPTAYASEFSSSPSLLKRIKDADRDNFITYFQLNNYGSTLGWGRTCSPGTWTDDYDYSSSNGYLCRHAHILPDTTNGYHRQSYDIGYVVTHELQHNLGMSTYSANSDSADDPHVAAEGGEKRENSCWSKVKWMEPLNAVQSGCQHAHFWWNDETEIITRNHLVQVQTGDPDATAVTNYLL